RRVRRANQTETIMVLDTKAVDLDQFVGSGKVACLTQGFDQARRIGRAGQRTQLWSGTRIGEAVQQAGTALITGKQFKQSCSGIRRVAEPEPAIPEHEVAGSVACENRILLLHPGSERSATCLPHNGTSACGFNG